MRPTALVTGIEGFTGPYMAAELARLGYDVHGLSRSGASCSNRSSVDLLDRDGLGEVIQRVCPDVVVHLAGISHVAHRDVSAIYQANIVGTRNLLDALTDLPKSPSKVLVASSAHVYGSSSEVPFDERSPMHPFNDYAVSKVAAEHVANLYTDRLPIVITRPFNYTGVGQSSAFFVPKIVDHAKRGERRLRLGNLDVERDFTDVRDLAHAYGSLLRSDVASGVYNVCSGRSSNLRSVIDTIGELAGVEFEIESDAEFIRNNEVSRLAGNNARLLAATSGMTFRPLRETLEWMLGA